MLGQSATAEQGPWRGTAEVQMDVRDEVIASDCRLLDESFNNSVARWLTAWNWPGAAPPRMVRDASPSDDLDKRAAREERISRFSGLRPTAGHIEDVYGGLWELPPAPPYQHQADGRFGLGLLTAAGLRDGRRPQDALANALDAMLAADAASRAEDKIESLAGEIDEAAMAAQDADIDRIRALVEGASSMQEIADGLLALWPEMDQAALAGRMREALTVANLMGRTDIGDGP